MGLDQRLVNPAGDKGFQGRPLGGRAAGIEPTVVQVGNAWGEPESQQMAESEHMIGNAPAIGMVHSDGDVGTVVEQIPVADDEMAKRETLELVRALDRLRPAQRDQIEAMIRALSGR